jgi:ribose transport system permease protein
MTETQSHPGTEPSSGAAPTRTEQRTLPRVDFRRVGELAAFVVLIIVFTALNPDTFPTTANFRTILDQAALPLIIGVGATLVIVMGSIDLSVEGVMGAAGMTYVLLSANSRNSTDLGVLAIPIALLVGIGLGLLSGLIHTRVKVPSFIVTLGVWFVGLGVATLLFGQAEIPFLSSEKAVAWPSNLSLGLPNAFLLAVAVLALGVFVTRFTRFGRFAYAIGNNELIARDIGVPVARYKLYVFVAAATASALAGIVGSLQLGAGSATLGTGTLFLTIAAVVIGGTSLGGGRGGIMRTALGVLLLTTLNNGLILSGVSPNIQSAVSGAVLVLAISVAAWPQRDRLRVVK